MAKAGLKVVGFPELNRVLTQLPKALNDKIAKQALTQAATPILRAARRNLQFWLRRSKSDRRQHNREPGNLLESLKGAKARIVRKGRSGPYVVIGPSYPLGSHGHLMERGSRRQRPRPFMRPAIDTNKYRAKEIVRRVVARGLEREAKRLVKRRK